MKWIFGLFFLTYISTSDCVLKIKEMEHIAIEPNVNYDSEHFLRPGVAKTIKCKAMSKNQKLEWIDPFGNVVKRDPSGRVFVQEHFVQQSRIRLPNLVLSFVNITTDDVGQWTCRSGNTEKVVSLCVIDPSHFDNTPEEVTVDLGRSITLSCQAKGSPEPRIEWRRNGEIISDDDMKIPSKYNLMTKYNIEGFEGLLTIKNLDRDDIGLYTCEAIQESILEDCVHSETFNVTLNINSAPVIEDSDDIKLVYAEENHNVELVCAGSGYPDLKYEWFKIDGAHLMKLSSDQLKFRDNESILTVTANTLTFGQRYMCRVSNVLGNSDKKFVILKLEKPAKPSDIIVYNITDKEIQLNISWEDTVQFPVDGVIIEYLKAQSIKRKIHTPTKTDWRMSEYTEAKLDDVDEEGIFVTLTDLVPETEYWLRVRATNEAGTSPWSDAIAAETLAITEPAPTEILVPEKVESSNSEYTNTLTYGGLFVLAMVVAVVFCTYRVRKL